MQEHVTLIVIVVVAAAFVVVVLALLSERRAKRTAELAQSRFFAMMEATGFGVLVLNMERNLVYVNQAACDILGYTESQLIGQGHHILRAHGQVDVPESELESALGAHRAFVGRDHFVDIRGNLVPVMVTTAPLAGQRGGNAVVFRDRSTEDAEERQRRDAIALISHELRSPLTSLVGFSNRLERAVRDGWAIEAERAEEIALLAQEARRMRDIVTVVLDVSNLERHIATETEPLLLRELIDDETERLAREQPGARFLRTGDADVVVESDERFVRRIIQNLLENALKYGGSEHPIEIIVEPEHGGYAIRVRDRGPGMSPDVRDHVFDRFYRAPAVSGQRSGLGLGLYLSRQLAALLGGHMAVESEEGQGTTFSLWLPPQTPETATVAAREAATTAGGRLLW
ncbi:MAG: PAS domain-containing sensor histidine kinase [Dehalococcoidia bacterium]